MTAGRRATPGGRSTRWLRPATDAVLALVLGACGDTAVGPPPAPQGVCECPEQAAELAEQPPGAPAWPDRWETEFSGVGFVSRGSIGPASGVDPDEAQDELLSWFLSSGFELLGSPGPGPTELPHENERVRVDLASGDQPVIAFQEASVNARYGWDVARWAEAMRKGTDEVAEFEARRDADAAALLEAARPRG